MYKNLFLSERNKILYMAFSVISNFIFNIKTHDKSHWGPEKTGKSYIVRTLLQGFYAENTL